MKMNFYSSNGNGIFNSISAVPKGVGTLLLILFGIILIVVGVFSTKSELAKKETYVLTEAKVTFVNERSRTITDEDGYTRREYEYAPEIEYYYEGTKYTDVKSYSSTRPSVGSIEEIYVNPNNPNEYFPAHSSPAIFVIMGVIVVIVGVISGIIGLIKKAVKPV